MDTIAQLIGSIRSSASGIVASLVASIVLMLATGQPIPLVPPVTHALHVWWPAILVVCILLYALTISSGVALTRRQRGENNALPGVRAGNHGVAIAAARVEGNIFNTGDRVHNDYARTTYVQGNGTADELRRTRHRPGEAGALMRGLGTYANAGDPDWEHVYDTTGAHRLRPRHPGAHLRRPIRVHMEMRMRPGEPEFRELLLRAWEDQQPVTIDPDTLMRFREFLGDDLMRDSADDPSMRITTTIQVQPDIPSRRCVLHVVETGDMIRNLNMAWFTLPSGEVRFTNRQDQAAPVWVTIDSNPQPYDAAQAGGVTPHDLESAAVQFEARPVAGRNARHLLALYDVLYALQERRQVKIIDDVTSEVEAAGSVDPSPPLAPTRLEFRAALRAVQDAFPATVFDLSEQPGSDDVEQLFRVARIVMTGTMTGHLDGLEMVSPATDVRKFLNWADERGVLHLPDDNGQPGRLTIIVPEDEMARLFGATINLGEKTIEMETARLVGNVEELRASVMVVADDASLRIALASADPSDASVTIYYGRFAQNSSDAA